MKTAIPFLFLAGFSMLSMSNIRSAVDSRKFGNENLQVVFLLTQDILDDINNIASPSDSAMTGNNFTVRNDGSDKDIRDIYTNKPLGRPVLVGDVFVIRNSINENGKRGLLDFVDVMVKRETGYSSLGGDFEYFRMDFDTSTNYTLHPNGIVPTLDNIYDRGTDVARAACVACHRNGGQDFLFTDR